MSYKFYKNYSFFIASSYNLCATLRATNIMAMYALANCKIVDKKWVKSSLRKIIDASYCYYYILYTTTWNYGLTLEKIGLKE